jgi:hypothetical protein
MSSSCNACLALVLCAFLCLPCEAREYHRGSKNSKTAARTATKISCILQRDFEETRAPGKTAGVVLHASGHRTEIIVATWLARFARLGESLEVMVKISVSSLQLHSIRACKPAPVHYPLKRFLFAHLTPFRVCSCLLLASSCLPFAEKFQQGKTGKSGKTRKEGKK